MSPLVSPLQKQTTQNKNSKHRTQNYKTHKHKTILTVLLLVLPAACIIAPIITGLARDIFNGNRN